MRYTGKELAEMFGVSEITVHYWKRIGLIEQVGTGKNRKCLYDERAVQAVQQNRQKRAVTLNREQMKESLCWTCIRAYGACSWSSKARQPVQGWRARKIHLQGYAMRTYKVLKCPLYEKELFERDEKGVKRRVNEIPMRNL